MGQRGGVGGGRQGVDSGLVGFSWGHRYGLVMVWLCCAQFVYLQRVILP